MVKRYGWFVAWLLLGIYFAIAGFGNRGEAALLALVCGFASALYLTWLGGGEG